jgi:DNA ligase-associated metallophosphoesterase
MGMQIKLHHQTFSLLPQKALFWHEQQALLVADMHVGKAAHFNKQGIPVPSAAYQNDLDILQRLIHEHQAKELIILGDLFHSELNDEFHEFVQWVKAQPHVLFTLIKGNHDIYTENWCTQAGISFVDEVSRGSFLLLHEYIQPTAPAKYIISGHIHPCVAVHGKARQSLRLPCFYVGETNMILPAFGQFTGMKSMDKKFKGDKFYAIAGQEVMPI